MFRTRLLPFSLATLTVLTAATQALAQPPVVTVVPCPAPPAGVPAVPVPAPAAVVVPEAVIVPAAEIGQVDLKFRREAAPPGGLAQMKVYITEPKPISTGGARFSFDEFESIEGIAISTPSDDGYGLAVVDGKSLTLSFVSPSATFGVEPDYPILTVVGRVPEAAAIGSRLQFGIDAASLKFLDPAGVPYQTEFENGFLDIQPVVSIHDVRPGSGEFAAGTRITITGSGFTRNTRIRFGETDLAQVSFVDSGRIDVTLGVHANLHGMRVRAESKDRDKSRITYFSYQRTRRAERASANALLASIVPIFPRGTISSTLIDVAADTAGVAVQNIAAEGAEVTIDVLGPDGQAIQTGSLTLPSSQFMVLTLAEIFGDRPPTSGILRVNSPLVPVQAMGVASDGVTARPQLARSAGESRPTP